MAFVPAVRSGSIRSTRTSSIPSARIVDPHHHLWPAGDRCLRPRRTVGRHRRRAQRRADRVHRVRRRLSHRRPGRLAPVGETEFVAGEAQRERRADRRHRRPRRSAAAEPRRGARRAHRRRATDCSAASATRCRAPNRPRPHDRRQGAGRALRGSRVSRRRRTTRRTRPHVRHVALPLPEPRVRSSSRAPSPTR